MGIVELFLYILLVCIVGYAAVWLLGQLAPGHPGIIDNIIWVIVVVLVVIVLAQAVGLSHFDPAVPRLR